MTVAELRALIADTATDDYEVIIQVPGVWAGESSPIWKFSTVERSNPQQTMIIQLDDPITS